MPFNIRNVKKMNRHRIPTRYISENDLLVLARKVVAKYHYTIPSRESEDVYMSIIEQYLRKEEHIWKNFKGECKPSTYCLAILNRLCCQIIRKELKKWNVIFEEKEINFEPEKISSEKQTIIKDEKKLLHSIIQLLLDEKYKFIVFYAFIGKLPPKHHYIEKYLPFHQNYNIIDLLSNYENTTFIEQYKILSSISFIADNKGQNPDAIRMWLNKNIETIIKKLNGPFKRSNYDKKSLLILFEFYYLDVNP